jgi:MoaA/NifB/PqqE/SkfB family radical SAM enzyme
VGSKLPSTLISPRAITVLGTYRCTAECEHCCFESNPRLKQRLSLDQIVHFIRESAESFPHVETVVFSGGECFLLGDDLNEAIRVATSLGLGTRCVTNGFWAKSLKHGRRRLEGLRAAGLRELNVSTGDFHQRWVSEEAVVNAACLGVDLDLETVVAVELRKDSSVTAAGLIGRHPRLAELLVGDGAPQLNVIESPWMPMDPHDSIDQQDDRLVDRTNVHLRGGCKSIFTTLVITPAERVGLCCGLSRERIPELNLDWESDTGLPDLIDSAARDFLKIAIFVDGPERVLAWAASKNPSIDWEGRYSHHCHACLRVYSDPVVRRTIADHYRERVDDVLMRYSVLLRQQELLDGAVYA